VVSLTTRTAASALYAALGWARPSVTAFPDTYTLTKDDPQGPLIRSERQFQSEVGFYLKSSEPGFRGFDFQARLGFEDRLGRCGKLAPNHLAKDVIDVLATKAKTAGAGTVRDLLEVLKDRIFGQISIDEEAERPALEAMLGVSLDADASTLVDPNPTLRRVCGVMITSPQALLSPIAVVPPDGSGVPKLTPNTDKYESLCSSLEALTLPDGVTVTCNGDEPLTVSMVAP
jgi:hypothetical protein